MARFKKVDPRMYGDEKFCRLSPPQPNGQSLFTYLISGPHTTNVPGLFSIGEAGLAEKLRWPLEGFREGLPEGFLEGLPEGFLEGLPEGFLEGLPEGFRKGFREALGKGFREAFGKGFREAFREALGKGFREAFREVLSEGLAKYDPEAVVISVPNAIKYDIPESPNVVKSWRTFVDEIPECPLKNEHMRHLRAFLEGLGEAFLKAFDKAFPEGFAESRTRTRTRNITNDRDRNEGGFRSGREDRLPRARENQDPPPPSFSTDESEENSPGPPHPSARGSNPPGPGGMVYPSSGRGGEDAKSHREPQEAPEELNLCPDVHSFSEEPPVASYGVSRVGECLPIAQIMDRRPIGAEHAEIAELLEEYRKSWGLPAPPIPPSHDNQRRVLEALRHTALGLDYCRRAIRGHRQLAMKDGSQLGRSFHHAFPPATIGGTRTPNRVDVDRVAYFAQLGGDGEDPGRQRAIEEARRREEEELERETAELAKRAGVTEDDSPAEKWRKIEEQSRREVRQKAK